MQEKIENAWYTPRLQKIGLLWPSHMQENTVYVAQFTVGAIRAKVEIVVLLYAACL